MCRKKVINCGNEIVCLPVYTINDDINAIFSHRVRDNLPPLLSAGNEACHKPPARRGRCRDAVQEVFLKLWETDTEVQNPMAFVVRSVRNVCLNRIAATDTRERFARRLSLDETVDSDTDAEVRDREIQSAVQTLLSPRERQVVDRIYAQGMSYKETAHSLDVSVALINKCIVSALKKLRTHFKTNSK